MFNSIEYTRKLESAGFTREQAEAQLEVMGAIVENNIATKQDLKLLEAATRADIEALGAELRADIAGARAETKALRETLRSEMKLGFQYLDAKIEALQNKLTIRLGGMIFVSFGLFATLIKYWIGH